MKRCPTCGRTYADESLSYCLDDGSVLSAPYEPEQTQRIPAPRATNLVTEALPAGQAPRTSREGRKPLLIYAIVSLLALLAGGAVVAWVMRNSSPPSTAKSEVQSNAASSTGAGDNLEEEKARLERERQQLELEKERQRLAEERRKLEEQRRASSSSTPNKPPPPLPGETWFVFLGSFPKDEYGRAEERLRYMQGQGYDARIIDTDEYPNLTGGLWAVVLGPYSKARAESQLTQAKSVRADAYVKPGW
ncbi:MAG TPA: SPOR domain-containing protein [Pyrinomonadaceae bacterium]|nr:SPOR domain-containing protein [Pyrinomonadaceae bacterium]